MAQLKDTQVNGNLYVSEDVQIGDISLTEEITKLNNKTIELKTVAYNLTVATNSYVTPYTHYGSYAINEDDINLYGEPISICATGASGSPVPCMLEVDRRGYRIASTSENSIVLITYLKS